MKLWPLTGSLLPKRILQSSSVPAKDSELGRLRAENARYKALLDAAPTGHLTLDSGLRIVEANLASADTLGTSASDLYLSSFVANIKSEDRLEVTELLSDIDVAGDSTISTSFYTKSCSIPVMLHFTQVDSSGDKDYYCHVAISDLSEHRAIQNNLRIARDGLHHVAYHDPLTRLPNRCGLVEQLNLAISTGGDNKVALLLLDVDHFKQINGPLGHQIGDKLLCEIASRLLSTVRQADIVGRLGGDEFAIIVKDFSSLSEITVIADKIKSALAQQYVSAPYEIRLSASIGVSVFPDHTDSAKQMLSYADAAMNHARLKGTNHIQVYTDALNTSLTERFELERDLRIALRDSQFELYYQPQYDLRTSSINSYEVLLRWKHPQRGVVGPESFIEVAEETGLIKPIGEWVLSEACKNLVELRHINESTKFGVNVSAKQFINGNLRDKITRILDETGVPANALELELTESALFEDVDHSVSVLQDLCKAGVELAIDDFGTGYSSFSRLQQLPVTRLKIDRSFVHDIPENPGNCSIVRAMLSVAHELGIDVVAEGVETHRQAMFLSEIGCDVLQGYYIGKPATFQQIKDKASLKTDSKEPATA